jgi:hypothetical protein
MNERVAYIVKKGPADMFRGDWYINDESMETKEAAIAKAAALTLASFRDLEKDWEQYGYEWSVFERENGVDKKIWEGFKYIQVSKPGPEGTPELSLGAF